VALKKNVAVQRGGGGGGLPKRDFSEGVSFQRRAPKKGRKLARPRVRGSGKRWRGGGKSSYGKEGRNLHLSEEKGVKKGKENFFHGRKGES